MKRILIASAALLLLSPGVALAGHGKAGLWNISTTMSMPEMPNMPNMPPEAMAMMKQRGMSMPGMGQPMVTQICLTQADVDADRPPEMNRRETNCDTKVDSMTPTSMSVTSVCKGTNMEGTGHMQVSYSSAEHYQGSYSFKGNMEGHPSAMSSTFKGDWVKADCGNVKPFARKAQ
jgi:hypothetical protein